MRLSELSAGGEASLIQSLATIAKHEVSAGHESGEADAPTDEYEMQLKILEEHVVDFCRNVQPELKTGTFKWLTYITDVDSADMALRIMHAFRWGKRDASHGLLFTKQAFHDKNSTLLLWSGVSPESREKWCKALNTYMLHAGSNDELQTLFGRLIEETKDHNGKLLGGCEWLQQEPIWQTASDAVVWRNGDALVRFLVNKPLVKEKWTLRETIFYRAELPTLARYPPAQGFRVLNLHTHVRCIHLMPIIRHKIEQNGLLDDWRKTKTFSCVDTLGEQMQDPEALDSQASEFMKPGEQMKPECAVSALTEEVYERCRGQGQVDYEFFHTMAMQFPTVYRPDITSLRLPDLVREHPQLFFILPDVMEMFDTTTSSELCLVQFADPKGIKTHLKAGLLRQACREAHAALHKLTHNALTDSNQAVRRAAAEALGAMGKEAAAAMPKLAAALQDSDEMVQAAAAEALGAIGGIGPGIGAHQAVWPLRKALKSPFERVRRAAAGALVAIGKEAPGAVVAELRKALQDFDDKVRAAAAKALGAMGKEAAGAVVPELRKALHDFDDVVRAAAAEALGAMGKEAPGAVMPELRKAFQDSKYHVRAAAAEALGAMGKEAPGAVMPELRKALQDSDERVRAAAAKALGAMGKEAAGAVMPELRKALQDSKYHVRAAAAKALGAMGKEAAGAVVPELRKALQDSHGLVRFAAALALGATGKAAAGALPELRKALQDSEDVVRAAAAEALAAIGKAAAGALPELRKAVKSFKDSEPVVQEMATEALKKLSHAGQDG